MRPTVVNESEQPAPDINWEELATVATSVLEKEELAPFSIVFVPEKRGAELNKKYRSGSGATNVLSFKETRDIVITPAVARREANQQGVSFMYRVTYLAVHGLLHLEGYTHDTNKTAKEMERLEQDIFKKLF